MSACLSWNKYTEVRESVSYCGVQKNTEQDGVYLPPFAVKNKPVYFAEDNTDFDEATPDGTNTLHGTIIVMFQQETDNAPMSNEIEIDPKSKETVSLSDYDVPLSQLSETALMKSSAETFSVYNYFTKNRQSRAYETHKDNASTKDFIWLLCYLHWQSKENSSREATEKVSETNRGVIRPLISSPPTSP